MADDVFPGFYNPELFDGWTKLPHELFDKMHRMSDTELRVVLYIFRHTWGFSEFGDEKLKHLTTDDFMNGRTKSDGTRMDKGTGLSDWGVRDGLSKASKHGYITFDVDARDKGRIRKSYGIKIRDE
jgi:hypothetical protein